MFNSKDLYCIQWQERETFDIYGSFSSSKYAAMDIMLLSCNTKIVNPDGTVMNGLDNAHCVQDKEEVLNYLGTKFNFIFYYN